MDTFEKSISNILSFFNLEFLTSKSLWIHYSTPFRFFSNLKHRGWWGFWLRQTCVKMNFLTLHGAMKNALDSLFLDYDGLWVQNQSRHWHGRNWRLWHGQFSYIYICMYVCMYICICVSSHLQCPMVADRYLYKDNYLPI
jgi:hypothetical protein